MVNTSKNYDCKDIGFLILNATVFTLLFSIIIAIFYVVFIVLDLFRSITSDSGPAFCCCLILLLVIIAPFFSFYVLINAFDVIFEMLTFITDTFHISSELLSSISFFLFSPLTFKYTRNKLHIIKLINTHKFNLNEININYYDYKGRLVINNGKEREYLQVKESVISEMIENGVVINKLKEDKYKDTKGYKRYVKGKKIADSIMRGIKK